MTARMRRLASDYEEIKKNFAGHKNIIVTPVGDEPPEKYHITYFVNGIYLLPDGKIETLGRHEVEITLHADYPRYKPICKILTPIWHPNFRDGQICIGDIWGAGESLTDIIINIGDMIQYKSWNSFSPLSADAAKWAIENKNLFPVGNVNLYIADQSSSDGTVDIDLLDDNMTAADTDNGDDGDTDDTDSTMTVSETPDNEAETHSAFVPKIEASGDLSDALFKVVSLEKKSDSEPAPVVNLRKETEPENDFEITKEELEGIEFVPSAERMQTVSKTSAASGKVNIKTVLEKGLLWALIGSLIGFAVSEFTDDNITSHVTAAKLSGHSELVDYFDYSEKAEEAWDKAYSEYTAYCKKEGKDSDSTAVFRNWYSYEASDEAVDYIDDYSDYDDLADSELYYAYLYEYDSDADEMGDAIATVTRTSTAMWSGVLALFIGLFLGIGEGVYYGSKEKAVKYALIGAGVSIVVGFISGYLAQTMYSTMLEDDASGVTAALVRGLGWAIMGLGIGVSAGLIKPEKKRLLFCAIGGLIGAFIGGFLFNYICDIIPDDIVARGVAIVIMGVLIGVGVGLLEQFAKQAWLKVIRGEFEGKEYLVFAGTTSIGNNGSNTIVLFKDKLVAPHHCDINLEGGQYVLTDCGSALGTLVNGQKKNRHVLRQGDAIAIGNSVLVFNMK